jgi:hypothetical protein
MDWCGNNMQDRKWKIGDFIRISWAACENQDVLQIMREDRFPGEIIAAKIWCNFIKKASEKAQRKNDEVWMSLEELDCWPHGPMEIISDEKEKLAIILKGG